jgi:hypothetical protein
MSKDKPFVRESSSNLGIRKLNTMKLARGLDIDTPKHEELYLDYVKKGSKRDINEDEKAYMKDPNAYSF